MLLKSMSTVDLGQGLHDNDMLWMIWNLMARCTSVQLKNVKYTLVR